MKVTMTIALLLLAPAALVFGSSAESACCDPPAAVQASAPQAAPSFFCRRTALSSEQRQRQQEVGKVLRAKLLKVREVERGYEFDYPDELSVYQALTEYIPFERSCCPFFEFSMRLDPEHGGIHLALMGSEGVKDFIRQQFAWAFTR